ncbi:hypothetical protein JAAARDRAFT_37756 [Jaapia argillacea MUCL 33604]|uniref:Cyclopropane-fatty-acyl-phospholipid synthase n=1 Tax=Jaapia argillacea MUCL 33604 TaxID=933084 RepID=A0A067PJZ7_9AGAM|nr:hypothetical protein JAAARDRAFT_37756 [Jaapia argillacea MUCL 33604]
MALTISSLNVLKPSSSFSTISVPNPRSWLISFARESICSVLERGISNGYLEIKDSDHRTRYFGVYRDGCNAVVLRVFSDEFWVRVLFSGDLGFSEAYIYGDVEVSDLKGIMKLWLENTATMASLSSLSRLSSVFSSLSNAFFGQTKWRARANVIASYDQSNDLFKAFLSREMMYSCALWGHEEGGVMGDLTLGLKPFSEDLENAQLRKIRHVLKKARVHAGSRVLEFGSGWGGLAIVAAKECGCSVDTLTLSVEQKKLAEERVKEAGLEGKITVHLMDYRDVLNNSEWEHSFDAFVSVEMIEHVGASHYKTYFKVLDYALKSHGAAAVVTSSTFPECRYTGYQAEDFMRRYMWPNSCLPSATVLVESAQLASQGRFILETVENHSSHYPRTLRTWSRRLESSFSTLRPILVKDFPSLAHADEFEAFQRKWRYFFEYAGTGFEKGWISCHMLTFVREGDCNFD